MPLDTYIQNFLKVIREFRYDNTYKAVWSKSIVSLCSEGYSGDIQLMDISRKVFPLYWNLHIFFDPYGKTLRQGNNNQRTPEIVQYVLGKIKEYRLYKGESYKPVFFEQKQREIEDLGIDYPRVANILTKDVVHRFLNLAGTVVDLYEYEKGASSIFISKKRSRLTASHADILSEAILLRWTKILEDINNTTPRIAAKLSLGVENKKSRRSSLSSFREYLDLENPTRQCSVCNEGIPENELSIDHVIPWSFLYCDDLWNLLYAHKRCNSSRSNTPPDRVKIKFLNERNQRLLNLVQIQRTDLTNKKHYKALETAIDENLVHKMWTLYRGY